MKEETVSGMSNTGRSFHYDLIRTCRENGIVLWVENSRLKYRSEKEKPSEEMLGMLKREKENIISYLEKENNREGNGFRLTPIQYAYLVGRTPDYELGNINAHYYTEYSLGNIDTERLKAAVNRVIEKNEALRTVIYSSGCQEVLPVVPALDIPVVDADNGEGINDIRREWSHHMYPLGCWPMFNFIVSRKRNGMDILHFSFDCVILDAWSAKMMLSDIFKLYNGEEPVWPVFTFKEYLQREEDYLREDKNHAMAEGYWMEKLKSIPDSPRLFFRKEFNMIDKPYFKRLCFSFSPDETRILYERAKKYRFTPSAVVCTAFMKVLSFFGENKNLTLNLTLFNRIPLHKDVSQILGDFTNVGLASYFYSEGSGFSDEADSVQKQFWKLIQYRTYDGTRLLKKLSVDKPGKAVMPVVYTGMLPGQPAVGTNYGFKEVYAISQTPQVVLDHQARDDNGGLALSWDYIAEAFEPEAVRHMFCVYIGVIKKLIEKESWSEPVFMEECCVYKDTGHIDGYEQYDGGIGK